MLVNSYNRVNENNTKDIEDLETGETTGYPTIFSNYELNSTEFGSSTNTPWNHGYNYYIATPLGGPIQDGGANFINYIYSYFGSPSLTDVTPGGQVHYYYVRPVICLKSSVHLEWNAEENMFDL